ncbi:MAG: hypothetical protein ACUVSU_04725 [Aggregatilineaceae bacterium]
MNQPSDVLPEDELSPSPTPDEATEQPPSPEERPGEFKPQQPPVEEEMRPVPEPPQIVAETPVGGLRPAVPSLATTPAPAEPAEIAAPPAAADETLRLPLSAEEPSAAGEVPPPLSTESATEAEEGEAAIVTMPVAPQAEAPAATAAPAAPLQEGESAPTGALAAMPPAAEAEVPAEETPSSLVSAALAAVAGEAEAETPPPAPAEAEVEERLTSPQEWEEDLSPELAAVLFGSPRQAAVTAPPAAAPAAEPTVLPPAEPVALTSEEQAMTLPLSAAGQRAPAPDVTLTGKVRYTRLEEPLPGDEGQHIVETWVYFKPDLPGLEGRLVQRLKREEWRYSDGSWRWFYERRYADGGTDRREVRANAARTYFERTDTVSQRDPSSGKRQQLKEEAALIFAAPIREEKRGFLRSLFGRGGTHEDSDEKAWRPATPAEVRQAHKSSEQALRRGGLGSLFG